MGFADYDWMAAARIKLAEQLRLAEEAAARRPAFMRGNRSDDLRARIEFLDAEMRRDLEIR